MPAIADALGEFAARTTLRDVPDEVLGRARHLALDSVGVAFAAVDQEFTQRAREAAAALGSGEQPVLGLPDRLAPREAALLNAVLVHGLDFDDTHLPAVTHVSATALPVSIAAAIQHGRSAEDLLLAYVLGIEISARIGTVAHGGFHATGFHPTGLAGAFGSSVAAAKLAGLSADGIAESQRIVGSMASGILEFLTDGAWTKRLHPGWAATSALTAATFASVGWPGPEQVYEGRYGLYATHLRDTEWDATEALDGLGERWELLSTAVKPYPSCHFTHAFADAILFLKGSEGFDAAEVATVRCLIHETPAAAVCEPIERKRRPRDDYDAKFSLPFIAGACLARDRLTLEEFTSESLADPEILRLAQLVEIADDPNSRFPQAYSAEVEIVLTDGRRLHRREDVNRGHTERPLSDTDIRAKASDNLGEHAQRTTEHVLALGTGGSAAEFAEALRAS